MSSVVQDVKPGPPVYQTALNKELLFNLSMNHVFI